MAPRSGTMPSFNVIRKCSRWRWFEKTDIQNLLYFSFSSSKKHSSIYFYSFHLLLTRYLSRWQFVSSLITQRHRRKKFEGKYVLFSVIFFPFCQASVYSFVLTSWENRKQLCTNHIGSNMIILFVGLSSKTWSRRASGETRWIRTTSRGSHDG